jgi:hypothetical protein
VLYLCKFSHYGVHKQLCLQELLLVYGTIEQTLKLEIPEEVPLILPSKEVILKIFREITQYLLECKGVFVPDVSDIPVEEQEVPVEGV